MSFKFAVRPAALAEAESIFELLVSERLYHGTLQCLADHISGMGADTYWVAVRDGKLLGVLRALALGIGFDRFIAADRIVLSPLVLQQKISVSALEIVKVLLERALGDIPAFAVANDSQVSARPAALAIISKAFLAAGFLPVAVQSSEVLKAEPEVAQNPEREVVQNQERESLDLRQKLAKELGEHVKSGQVFVR